MPSVDKEMVCPGCGAAVSSTSETCEYCGRKIVLTSLNFKQVRRSVYKDSARFLESYREVLKDSPDDPQVLAALGYAFFDKGQYVEAMDKLEAATAKGSDDPDVLFHMALARFKSKKPFQIKLKEAEEIVATVDSAIELNPLPQYYCAKAIIIRKLFEQRYVQYRQSSSEVMDQARTAGMAEGDESDMESMLCS